MFIRCLLLNIYPCVFITMVTDTCAHTYTHMSYVRHVYMYVSIYMSYTLMCMYMYIVMLHVCHPCVYVCMYMYIRTCTCDT